MKVPTIALFGASGRTGRCVIEEAADRGIDVRGLVRNAGSLSGTSATEVVGSFEADSAVDATLEGCSAACIVIGPHPPYTDVFCARATEAVLEGMTRYGLTRVVCQTGAMIGAYPHNRSAIFELATRIYQRRQPEPHQDRVQQENLMRDSQCEWTVVKPPRLTMGPRRSTLTAGPTVKVGLLSSVSRRSLAHLIVNEIAEPQFLRQVVFVRD